MGGFGPRRVGKPILVFEMAAFSKKTSTEDPLRSSQALTGIGSVHVEFGGPSELDNCSGSPAHLPRGA